ncbi:MAG: hypothetical protein ACO1SV_08500 [Fimbriimonas sp.]
MSVPPSPPPTGIEIVRLTHAAYDAVATLEQRAEGAVKGSSHRIVSRISFARPSCLRVTGVAPEDPDDDFELLCDGKSTWVYNAEEWEEMDDIESGIGAVAGISLATATLIPATLFHTTWGSIGYLLDQDLRVTQDTLRGRPCHRLEAAAPFPTEVWIDARTHFFVRQEMRTGDYTFIVDFNSPSINHPIPTSRFER